LGELGRGPSWRQAAPPPSLFFLVFSRFQPPWFPFSCFPEARGNPLYFPLFRPPTFFCSLFFLCYFLNSTLRRSLEFLFPLVGPLINRRPFFWFFLFLGRFDPRLNLHFFWAILPLWIFFPSHARGFFLRLLKPPFFFSHRPPIARLKEHVSASISECLNPFPLDDPVCFSWWFPFSHPFSSPSPVFRVVPCTFHFRGVCTWRWILSPPFLVVLVSSSYQTSIDLFCGRGFLFQS